jgi:hypothetical protein
MLMDAMESLVDAKHPPVVTSLSLDDEATDDEDYPFTICGREYPFNWSKTSCNSRGCDIGCDDISHYKFIPKYRIVFPTTTQVITSLVKHYDKKFERIQHIDDTEYVYCDWCMNHSFTVKSKNGKGSKKITRIYGFWDKDDYGYVNNSTCDFCNINCSKLILRLSTFRTVCEYNGDRCNSSYFIATCNKCIKKNPKQVFKRVNMEGS